MNSLPSPDRYESIADTFVQLFDLRASGVIASSPLIHWDTCNKEFFTKGTAPVGLELIFEIAG